MSISMFTTMVEFQGDLAQLSYPTITISVHNGAFCASAHLMSVGFAFGTGPTVAIALEEALANLREKIANAISHQSP